MNIAVVFDSSAMTAYVRGSAAVGEMLTMVGEEDRYVALPVCALADAFRQVSDDNRVMLQLLVSHSRTAVIPLDLPDAEPVGLAARITSFGAAHTAVVARGSDACVLTASAKSLAGLVDDGMIIEV